MLTIKLSPIRSSGKLVASWVAPILTVNSVEYDLSELPDGSDATHQILNKVSRSGDNYEVRLILPHGPNAPDSTRFPGDIVMENNGELPIPVWG